MSTWDVIEEVLNRVPVLIKLERRETIAVNEALVSIVRDMVESRSAWEVLENWGSLNETSVLGLNPHEVELIKHFERGAQSKTGNTGEVMQLTPKVWKAITDKLSQNSDYYEMLLNGTSSVPELIKKIESRLALDMGAIPAGSKPPGIKVANRLAGDPSDPTPVQRSGAEQMGWDKLQRTTEPEPTGAPTAPPKPKGAAAGAPPNPVSAPSPESPEARRRRVAAQDMASMGAKSKKDIDAQMKKARTEVK